MREAGLSFSIVANYVIVLLACFPDHEWVLISHAYRHGKLFPILLVTSTWLFESFCPSFFDFVEKQNCSGKKKSHVFLTKVCLKIWPVLCSGSISRPSQFLSFVVTTIITFLSTDRIPFFALAFLFCSCFVFRRRNVFSFAHTIKRTGTIALITKFRARILHSFFFYL